MDLRMGGHKYITACYLLKKHAVMYCMFPHSNFDDWKCKTDKRCIRNEIPSYDFSLPLQAIRISSLAKWTNNYIVFFIAKQIIQNSRNL